MQTTQKQTVLNRLNTMFGKGKYSDYFEIESNRLRQDENNFILETNTLDNESENIIDRLGYTIISVNDILDSRKITFN